MDTQQAHQHSGSGLSEYEEQLYDRSIRLWGLEAQKRLRTANILLVGFGGLNAEICKNLVLAGIRSVTIMDDAVVTPTDLGCHLFLTEESIGKNRAEASVERVQALNPLVQISADTGSIESKPDSFFLHYALVCVSNQSLDELIKLDHICRGLGVYFLAADSFGLYSYFFSDLHKFFYTKIEEAESEKPEESTERNAKRLRTDATTNSTTTTTSTTTTSSTDHSTNTTPTTDGTNNHDTNNNNNNNNSTDNSNNNNNTEHTQSTHEAPTQKLTRVEVPFATLAQALETPWKIGVARRGREGLPRLYVGLHLLYAIRSAGEGADGAQVWEEVAKSKGANTALLPAEFVTSLTDNARLQLAPVCAIVGGVAGQEIIKIISANDAPLNNFFLYDSTDASGVVEQIPPATKQ